MDSRDARKKLSKGKNHQDRLADGQYLMFRKSAKGGAGTWLARWRGEDGRIRQCQLGNADDFADADGETILTYAQAETKAESWFKECAQLAKRIAAGEVIPTGVYTVKDAFEDYLADRRRDGMKSAANYESVAKTRIYPVLGAIPLADLTKEQIHAWHRGLAASGRLRTGGKRKEGAELKYQDAPEKEDEIRVRQYTANKYLNLLRVALNIALDRGKTRTSPWKEVKAFPHVDRARTRFLSQEEQVRLVNACPPDFRRLVQGALLCGGRYSELGAIQAQDYNKKSGTIWIKPGKTGKGRHVFLTAEAMEFFSSLCTGKGGSGLLFVHDSIARDSREDAGLRWVHSDQALLMRQACKAAKVESLTFHELRHTYASTLLNHGVAMAYVAAQLGHTSLRMCEKFYGHLAPSAVADSIRKNVPSLGITEPAKVKLLKLKKA
jgi:integrase